MGFKSSERKEKGKKKKKEEASGPTFNIPLNLFGPRGKGGGGSKSQKAKVPPIQGRGKKRKREFFPARWKGRAPFSSPRQEKREKVECILGGKERGGNILSFDERGKQVGNNPSRGGGGGGDFP